MQSVLDGVKGEVHPWNINYMNTLTIKSCLIKTNLTINYFSSVIEFATFLSVLFTTNLGKNKDALSLLFDVIF